MIVFLPMVGGVGQMLATMSAKTNRVTRGLISGPWARLVTLLAWWETRLAAGADSP